MDAAAGDARAPLEDADCGGADFRRFYGRYARPLVCYVDLVFPSADAESVVQDTLLRAFQHWSQVSALANPWPWLAVTARNVAHNYRRDGDADEPRGLAVFDVACPAGDDVAEQVVASDQLRLLARAMEVLTPLQRQLLVVLVEEGLTGAEVARRLGMQPGTVRMHLCRMRSRLSERFIALGGRLAVVPGALGQLLVGRPARRSLRPSQLPLAAGSTAAALSVSAIAIGVIIGASGGPVRSPGAGPMAQDASHLASAAPHPAPAVRVAAPSPAARPASSPATVTVPVSYHATLSKDPTRPGKTADVGVEIWTPVGTIWVAVPVTMESGEPCAVPLGC